MATRTSGECIFFMLLIVVAAPAVNAVGRCNQPTPTHPLPPTSTHPPHAMKPPKHSIPRPRSPRVAPPVVVYPPPAVVNPPVVNPPPSYTNPPTYIGGTTPPATIPTPLVKCSIDVLRLGLCLDVLGLVHLGIRPVENFCCPVLQGLLQAEAALCLCTAIRLRVLNLNIYIPLALNVLVTCGKDPPPGYLCPAL